MLSERDSFIAVLPLTPPWSNHTLCIFISYVCYSRLLTCSRPIIPDYYLELISPYGECGIPLLRLLMILPYLRSANPPLNATERIISYMCTQPRLQCLCMMSMVSRSCNHLLTDSCKILVAFYSMNQVQVQNFTTEMPMFRMAQYQVLCSIIGRCLYGAYQSSL